MNQATDHLTNAQIENYISQDGTAQNPDAQRLQLEAHLADCESCLGRVLDAERIRLGLLEGDRMRETPYPGCPAEETLQELAAGIGPSEMVEATTEHAAHCDYCGPVLSRYMREFSDSLEAEDTALLAQLESSKPGWQKKFVRQYVVADKPKQSWSLFAGFWPKMATAGAGVAAVAVAFGLYGFFRHDDLSQAQSLVANAYSERRTIEMRLSDVPYAPYSPLPVQRSADNGAALAFQRPSLLRAGAAVGDKLRSGDNLDPRWLQIKARIDLLESTPASATDAQGVLEKAHSQGLDSPSLDIDEAASSFERANSDGNPDLLPAINLLRKALDDPRMSKQEQMVALFDLGIAYQKSKMYEMAVQTWERYLQLDSSSAWAKEAQDRLESSRKAAPPPKGQSRLDAHPPLFFLEHVTDPVVLDHLDDYQDRALRFWLPSAQREPNEAFSKATQKLAELLEQHDSDSWLREFLGALKGSDTTAVEALSAAIRANKRGMYGIAVEQARTASRIFAEQGNRPGELRARFEIIYASQRFLEGFDCLTQLASVQAPDRYRWLSIQFNLVKYTCSNFGGEFAAIQQGLENSRKRAEASNYHLLALRAIALSASIKRQQQAGCREVWDTAIAGLDLYWRQASDRPDLLYEFYSILEQCAAQRKLWYAAEGLQRRSIALVQMANKAADPNLILEGSTHAELAAILAAQGKNADADLEQNAADSQWNQIRNEKTANTYRLFMRVRLAEIELDREDAQRALSTLNSSDSLLNTTQYQLLSLDFYRVLGKTCWRLQRLSEASSAFEKGISIAENALRSIQGSARLRWVTKIDDVYRGAIRVWLDQGRTDEAWKLWEWYRTRSLAPGIGLGVANPLAATSWTRIAAEIAKVNLPLEQHLVYAGFEDGVEIWLADTRGIRAHWIKIRGPDLSRLVNDFAENCADPSSSLGEVHAQAQTLYELLLQPVVPDLSQGKTLVVELDRVLSKLILPALITPEGRYLSQTRAVVYSPGVLAEQNLRSPLPVEKTDRLFLLDASEPDGAGAVPGHLQEREAAFQAYSHVRLLNGDHASTAEIKRELARSTVFGFIGHGEQHDSHTELRLNSTAFLTADDFPHEALTHLKLSVLSACSTGVSSDDRLLDTANLVHPFLAAGVPDVVASQWNVDSTATTELMQNFYARVGSGETAALALNKAQNEILVARNHPYFWAGFNVSGRAN